MASVGRSALSATTRCLAVALWVEVVRCAPRTAASVLMLMFVRSAGQGEYLEILICSSLGQKAVAVRFFPCGCSNT